MSGSLLEVRAGRAVRAHVAHVGFRFEDFPTLLGAAGGPKWLVLHGLDRVLAPRVLGAARRGGRTLDLIGSSIGGWRFAAWLREDPVAALDALFESYTHARWFTGERFDFTEMFRAYVDDMLGETGVDEVLGHDCGRLHLVLAHLPPSPWPHWLRLGAAIARNAISRDFLLSGAPQRLVASSAPPAGDVRRDWPHLGVSLDRATLVDALLGTAAVPGMIRPMPSPGLEGVSVDGGLIDYHFDGSQAGDGFVLYPHFYPVCTPGWFDKAYASRRLSGAEMDRVLLISPSAEFVAALPGGKVPDRKDPMRLDLKECRTRWRAVSAASMHLGDALAELLEGDGLAERILASATA